ncbi:HlyD family efflux transporter periplasmic adaptor subunit [Brevibacillus formosus]|uniref:HlyD family secretion protein n=1 Tax=Brevibacillus TaxID=55080 RepID=UPI000D0F0649|nr:MULTISPECIES: HlyD family efflux transporter periplasmic adaptor subunit [Brevibacillus]MBG9940824.1 multidrug transporter [Brevibacillus formosus]MED1943309.1 HlyD family efflux transporter periplasmic adaptor subunit [Brevibacillus formosus]MED2000319.1 HlyD family efflux transporter periplasmic adaptor subunit [Brevibacillus formosus]MED2082972.1 HlyD family efflux transporter periplasmic adaptor subunit [Brevibacillus formosus]PSK17370.1 multidrug transporter [Brevibacillus sp. NRRL NRS
MNKRAWIGVGSFVVSIAVLGTVLFGSNVSSMAGQNSTKLAGVIEGTEVDLSFKMGGSIEQLSLKEGDEVKAGQVVATLSSAEILAKKEQAEAAYKLSLVRLDQAKKGVSVTDNSSNAQVDQAKAAVNSAQAQLDANKNGARSEEITQLKAKLQAAQTSNQIAATNLERMKKLMAEGAVPQVKVEEAQMQADKAQAEFKAAEEQLKMAQTGSRKEQVDAAQAQLDQAKAAYNQAVAGRGQVGLKELDVKSAEANVMQAKGALAEMEAYVNNTKLTAPVDGIVKSVAVQKGELVSQGFTVLTIQTKSDNYVKFYVNEYMLANVKTGDQVKLFVPALNREVDAKVVTVAPAADFAVKKATQELGDRDIRSFQVKLLVSDPELRPGLTVEWQLEGAGNGE